MHDRCNCAEGTPSCGKRRAETRNDETRRRRPDWRTPGDWRPNVRVPEVWLRDGHQVEVGRGEVIDRFVEKFNSMMKSSVYTDTYIYKVIGYTGNDRCIYI